jgi:hypothetical protein
MEVPSPSFRNGYHTVRHYQITKLKQRLSTLIAWRRASPSRTAVVSDNPAHDIEKAGIKCEGNGRGPAPTVTRCQRECVGGSQRAKNKVFVFQLLLL